MNAETAQTRDPELTRARILEAATALFVEHGFADVSMSRIAADSGVTKSLIHHHFGSKEQLWEDVKEAAFEGYFRDQLAQLEAEDDPGPELLKTSVARYFRFLKDNPRVVRLFAWTHLEGDTSCGRMDKELVRFGAERVRQAQENGTLRPDVNPTHVVATFVMACTQWFEAEVHHDQWPGMGDDEDYLEDFLKIFMEGLLPRD